MQIFPTTGLEIIEFDKVVELIKSQCLSEEAMTACDEISPSDDIEWIDHELNIVQEAAIILEEGLTFLRSSVSNISAILKNLEVDGFVLSSEDLAELRSVLLIGQGVYDFFDADRKSEYPVMYNIASQIPDATSWLAAIDRILTADGDIRDDASQVLVNISREVRSKKIEGDKIFQAVVRKYSKDGWLSDTLESVRNERRVLAVKAEFKRKLRGIVHDQSATGRTAFVEPEEVIPVNNDLFELSAARRVEEYRLLSELCVLLRPYESDFGIIHDVLIELDVFFGKAKFARRIEGVRPQVADVRALGIKQARHPLLLLKNSKEGKETVPFDLDLHGSNAILLLSGPNAGGKSILMKSVGLLQVMVQSGLLIPVDPESQFGIFGKFCVELGDRQSIENDLSTYSSRLLDMKEFLEVADDNTLLLIDEFGSGTDPKLGGAIAEAILDQLHKKGVYGVLTTHYSELKIYAYKKKGVLNGAMIFDQKQMLATYKLRIGKPGSSFTFEIAENTGLPKSILAYAKDKAGKNTRALEELLVDLETKNQTLDKKLSEIADKERSVDRLMKNYDKMRNDLAVQRKRIKLEQKERDYQHLSQLNKELEKTVRQAQENKKLEEAKAQLAKVKKARTEARSTIHEINDKLAQDVSRDVKREWKVGDPVKVAGGSHTGKIEKIDRNKATVIIGQLRMNVKLKDLQSAGEPLEINPTVSITRQTTQGSGFNTLLDIRGMRVHEALGLVQKFMDEALLANAHMLRIVHGKGTGALKKMVETKLREYPVTDISQPEDQHGGAGATIITL